MQIHGDLWNSPIIMHCLGWSYNDPCRNGDWNTWVGGGRSKVISACRLPLGS